MKKRKIYLDTCLLEYFTIYFSNEIEKIWLYTNLLFINVYILCCKCHSFIVSSLLMISGSQEECYRSANHCYPAVHQTRNPAHHCFPSAGVCVGSWHPGTYHLRLWWSRINGNGNCLFVCLLGFNVFLNIWGLIAAVPACSSGTLTNVLPHRNAMPQTQDMTPHPVTVYRHGADLSLCYPLMWNVTLEYIATHFNVLDQTWSGNPSPTFHTHQ